MSLGELRQALLAVYLGNPRFTPHEQLQASHQTHEDASAPELSRWLQAARLTDAQRGQHARQRAADTLPQPGVCHDEASQRAELQSLLGCRALSEGSRRAYARVFAVLAPGYSRPRLALLGDGYLEALENLGKVGQPAHFKALYDN